MESFVTEHYSKFAVGAGLVFASLVTHHTLHRKEIQSEPWEIRVVVVTAVSSASFVFGCIAAPLLLLVTIADFLIRR